MLCGDQGPTARLADLGCASHLPEGDKTVCSNYMGITLLSLHRKLYARVLEWRVCHLVVPLVLEEQCTFPPAPPGCGTQLSIFSRIFEGVLQFAQAAYMCCVDLEKAFDLSLRVFCVRCFSSMGCEAHCHGSFCPYTTVARAWFALLTVNHNCSSGVLDSARVALYHRFCS